MSSSDSCFFGGVILFVCSLPRDQSRDATPRLRVSVILKCDLAGGGWLIFHFSIGLVRFVFC